MTQPSQSADRSTLPNTGRSGIQNQSHAEQLSLLPHYTQNNEEHSNGTRQSPSETGGNRWLTVLGVVGLIALGVMGWRWWQGRSTQQGQQGPRATSVELRSVDTATVEETSVFTGTLEAEQSVGVQAEQPGRIAEILVNQGQSVDAGAPILRLSAEREQSDVDAAIARIDSAEAARDSASSDLEALRADRERAEAEVALQEQQFSRTSRLVDAGALAREDLDLKDRDLAAARASLNSLERRIQAAQDQIREEEATLRERRASLRRLRENLQDTTVVAPFAGVIGDLPVEVGDYVQAGQDLTQLIDNDSFDLNLNIPQERSGDIRRGLPVEIITGEGDTLQTGQISFISPQVDADSRFIQTEVSFSNEGGQLRDGQFVRTEVIWERRPNRVVVPQTAVVYRGENRFVYVPQERDGQLIVQRQSVELGLEQGSQVEIISGLQPNQRIVVSGIQKIADGAPIRPLADDQSGNEG